MANTLLVYLIIGAFIGYVLLIPAFREVLWQLRGTPGIGTTFVYALAIAYAWMFAYLGLILTNRYLWRIPHAQWVLVGLGVLLVAQSWGLLIRYLYWRRQSRRR